MEYSESPVAAIAACKLASERCVWRTLTPGKILVDAHGAGRTIRGKQFRLRWTVGEFGPCLSHSGNFVCGQLSTHDSDSSCSVDARRVKESISANSAGKFGRS